MSLEIMNPAAFQKKWKLLFTVNTNSSSSTTFDPNFTPSGANYDWKWDLGDGTIIYSNTGVSHTYADSTTKTVNVYYRAKDWSSISNIGMNSDNLIGLLNLSKFDKFSLVGTTIDLYSNSSLTGVTFADTVTGVINNLRIYNTTIGGTLNLSMFNNFSNTSAVISLNNNSFTNVTFANSITGKTSTLNIGTCNLTGNLDLSKFTELVSAGISLNNNSQLTGVTFAPIISGKLATLNLYSCDIRNNLDLSMFTNIATDFTTFDLNTNSSLTGITFASGITGSLGILRAYSCNLLGTLNLSSFTSLASSTEIKIHNNTGLTYITMPVASGSLRHFWAYGCDLGYICFTGITTATNVNSSFIQLQNNSMVDSEVDHILVDLDTISISGYTSRIIDISGTNAAPTNGGVTGYDGLTAKSNLQTKGFTVTTS